VLLIGNAALVLLAPPRRFRVHSGEIDGSETDIYPDMPPGYRQSAAVKRFWKIAILLACALWWRQPARAQTEEHAPDTMEARVLACTSCHGVNGQGTSDEYFPRLAGKPAGYLFNQLIAFRDGRRHYPPMNYLLEYLPDAYLQTIAEYFAARSPPLPPPASPILSDELLALGHKLVTSGDPDRGIPACSGCHNPSFTGMEPAIPGLLGLPPNYISAQLGAWRYGTRSAARPDCMQIVAGLLTEADVTAVAAWLSALPAPANTAPVPKGSLAMPLSCGSELN
jgi:cytochrome c553